MNRVSVDASQGLVTVEGGALASHLLDAMPDDLVTVTGTARSVGVAGFAVAGGYGPLNSRFGLGADCIESARIVLANGEIATASEEGDRDLLWAIRGGGSGFGVVASLTLRMHRLERVLAGTLVFPLHRAKDVLLYAQKLLALHPFELSLFSGLATIPGHGPMLFMEPLWTGNSSRGDRIVEELQTRFGATALGLAWAPYKTTFNDEQEEKSHPRGFHYDLRTRFARAINAEILDVLIAAAERFTSPYSVILLHDFHGRASQIEAAATAFRLRENHTLVEVISAWSPDDAKSSAVHEGWRAQTVRELAPYVLPGTYSSLAVLSEAGRVSDFFGNSAERLSFVKKRVDPDDLFRSGIGRLAVPAVEDTA